MELQQNPLRGGLASPTKNANLDILSTDRERAAGRDKKSIRILHASWSVHYHLAGMGAHTKPLIEDYQYTEDQINPSVKIHAVSRTRSFFDFVDYSLIFASTIVSSLAYYVRLHLFYSLWSRKITSNPHKVDFESALDFALVFTSLQAISRPLCYSKGVHDDYRRFRIATNARNLRWN